MIPLEWKSAGVRSDPDALMAMVGGLQIGTVGKRDKGDYFYSVSGDISVRWIAKARGDVKSRYAAKQAVERAWAAWCKKGGLDKINV